MKNTRWEHTSDVTGGQASICRTHVLHFARNVLQPHLERLLQSDTHIRQVANITPQMLATLRAHQQSCSTTFTSMGPATYLPSGASIPSGHVTTIPAGIPKTVSGVLEGNSFQASISCSCGAGSGQCSGKACLCTKEGLWCGDKCRCQGGCVNPINQKLTPCARQALILPSQAPKTPSHDDLLPTELDKVVRLPCRCSSVVLRQLTSPCECAECGHIFCYSFCYKSIVSVDTTWHCEECGLCRDYREIHCKICETCSYTNEDGGCRSCADRISNSNNNSNDVDNKPFERSDCVIC